MFTEELKISQKPPSYNFQTLDINNALTKKAAGNIDINAMGDKGNNTITYCKNNHFLIVK